MLAPPQRKRPRSSSPPPENLTSPLDILLKRRRQSNYNDLSPSNPANPAQHPNRATGYFDGYPQPDLFLDSHSDTPEAESSNAPWNRFVEKRRTRQWEKLNAPQVERPELPPSLSLTFDSPPHHPAGAVGGWHSQPLPPRHQMSSSPIRHHPPSSSPFRPGHSDDTRVDEMDEEEMRREWGEQYAAQNSLLHSLHLARLGNPTGTPTHTPDQTLLQTPSMPTPPLIPTPYRSYHIPSSSPFNSHTATTQYTPGKEDDNMDMEMLIDTGQGEAEEEVKRRYEETNRLLAELEVVRRRRWGEGS